MSGDELYLGTEPMRNGLELDPKAVENYFNHLFPFLEENLSITQFRGGQSNPTYRVISGKHAWVIRRKPPGPLLPSAHAIDREYRVLSALGKTNVPVPKTYNLCMDENILGTPFYVMECVNGPVYWDALLPGKTMETRGVVYDSMNASIAKLHQADFEFLELGDFGRPGNYVDRQLKRWGRQYLEADFERILEMDLLIEWLEERIPEQTQTSIVHGDFRLDNMVFDAERNQVLAILDWELSTLGDPLADFAYHVMQWRIPFDLHRGLAGADLFSLGIPDENTYLESYCKRTGRTEIKDWDFYIIFSLFKMSAICYGILVRIHHGTAASEHALKTGSLARPFAKLAWDQVLKKNLD
ncbi:MAG TPA: phosphotransferase family protein [SAR324 cluster bacterium]|jgi:aminoglycoside phosphotransferase (APT) family kinase protein|nr:phosphotransferase family protein [SAR324 cluster bacterium]MDP6246561.1 phosphotransferase family protein [SAR324 cluster bacterium]MDP6638898.1 phosphotransferase family protein [SAR324 cluster bacterium]HJO44846.1 phosphotransferase family protein [SAR324 cluster bacterium]|tara:strand:- start:2709 stop:3773 length:1065 start_codon:yes stop_codon:yes gene_type:complete